MHRKTILSLLIPLATAQLALGVDAGTLWSTKVQALFDVNCVKCHGPIEQKAGLELDTPEAVLKGSEDGAVVVPGKPDDSPVYQNLLAKADPHMPPKKQLSDAERATVREWIAAMTAAPAQAPAKPKEPRHFDSVPRAIDTIIAEGWTERGVKPAPPVDDHTWCRRVYLDLAGRIPTRKEADTFLQEPAESRREALVDRLMASDEHAVRMRELWDVFLMGRGKSGDRDQRKTGGWWAFLENAFRKDVPWNVTVHEFLVARPDKPENKGAAVFLYERKNEFQRIAEAVAPVVYGTKIDCAQCHDHPLAREIKQGHYWGLVAAYNRGKNVDGSQAVEESAIGGFMNFTNLKKESQPALVTLLTGKTLAETWPAGDQKEQDSDDKYVDPKAKPKVPKYSRREAFAEAATTNNPLLARAFVNRMWGAFTGRGIVFPADEMNGRNKPSHPELLDWLAQDFAEHQYDTRRIIRGIVLSKVYALGASAGTPPEAFAGALERPLSAEQISRSWRVACAMPPSDDTLRRALINAMPDVLPREYNATFQQAQFLQSAPALTAILKPNQGNTADKLVKLPEVSARVREAFLAVYGRQPDAEEAAQAEAFLNERADKPEDAGRDLLWALMTSAEFLTTP
jgi:mono/diheme cytochrome c family protein